MKFVFFVSTLILLFCHGSNPSNEQNTDKSQHSPEFLSQLNDLCKKKGGCCQGSWEKIKKYSYTVLNVPGGPTTCPKGTQINVLRCQGSLEWCVPTTINPTSQNLDDLCEKSDACCQHSLKTVKKHSYLVLNLPGGPITCPKGTERDQLKCITSLKWCVNK